MKRFINKTPVRYAVAIMLCVGVFTFINSRYNDDGIKQNINVSISKIESIQGFAEGTKIDVLYTSASAIQNKEVIVSNDTPYLKTPLEIINQDIYRVDYQVNDNNARYIDVILGVNKNTNRLDISMSGLPPRQGVSLKIDNVLYQTKIPADWAGKLSLTHNLNAERHNKEICLLLSAEELICHLSPKSEVPS